ncbi:hypothetical protein AL517_012900 [Staphylococcus epidermidis]|nr:hypothetical protein AL517_012900 [Staphylococcus epidermidis]
METTTTPTYVNPNTGEKVGEGEPTEKITKQPVDEIVHYGGEEIKPGHKDEFDPMHRKVVKQRNQVSRGLKILIQAK